MTSRISRCRCRLRRCQVTRKTKGDTKVPRGTLYINIENAMACVPYSLTHAHVTTVAPPRLRSKGLHPSSHAHRVPGSRLRGYQAARPRLPLPPPYLTGDTTMHPLVRGRGCHKRSLRITNGHRPIYRSVLAVGPHREHALSQATFWTSQALGLLRRAGCPLEP